MSARLRQAVASVSHEAYPARRYDASWHYVSTLPVEEPRARIFAHLAPRRIVHWTGRSVHLPHLDHPQGGVCRVDVGIAPLVLVANAAGWSTRFSCSGLISDHPRPPCPAGYTDRSRRRTSAYLSFGPEITPMVPSARAWAALRQIEFEEVNLCFRWTLRSDDPNARRSGPWDDRGILRSFREFASYIDVNRIAA